MDTLIYGVTVALTIVWSVWNDALWRTRIGLDEGSALRMINVAGPSVYFLLVALEGWRLGSAIRLDLIGLLILDIVIAVSAVAMLVVYRLKPHARKRGYIWILSLYNLFAVVVTGMTFAVSRSPLLLIRLSAYAEDLRSLDFFSFAWAGVEGTTGDKDMAGLLNKILIALLSYVPVSLIRIAAAARQKQRLLQEIRQLSVRVNTLEDTIRRVERKQKDSNP